MEAPTEMSQHSLARRAFLAAVPLAAASGSAMAMAADDNPMRPVPIPAGVTAMQGYAEVAGTRLWYWDTGGNGVPVVMLHPASGSAEIWSYQQPAFAHAGYRVIAYSRRGYFNSLPVPDTDPGTAAGDLKALADFLDLKAFHIVATAGGCAFANDFALSYPDRLRSMVLASGLGGVTDADYLATVAALTPSGYGDLPIEFRELGPSYRAANPDGTQEWLARTKRAITGKRRGQTFLNKISWDALKSQKKPVMLLSGDADLNAPPSITRMFATRFPDCRLATVAEAGHSSHWERPDEFNRIVLKFLSQH